MTTLPDSVQTNERAAEQLHRRQAELRAMLQALAAAAVHASDEPAEVSDFKESAGRDVDAALQDTAAAQALQELAGIDMALRRMREGSYGTCEECGDAIAPARLLALPASTFCATCQAARERQAKRA